MDRSVVPVALGLIDHAREGDVVFGDAEGEAAHEKLNRRWTQINADFVTPPFSHLRRSAFICG